MYQYMETYIEAQNELLRASMSADYVVNDKGKSLETILKAAQNDFTGKAASIAEICLARWTSGLQDNEPLLLLALQEAYTCGVIDGKRAERAKKKTV